MIAPTRTQRSSLLRAAMAALTLAAWPMLVPPPAPAAEAGVGFNGVGYYAGRSDTDNRVDVRYARRTFTIRNREERIVPGRGCRAATPRRVLCSPERSVGRIKIEVFGGDDTVILRSAPKRFSVSLLGGAGDDVLSALAGGPGALYGDSGSDVLRGSAARDFLQGAAGDDRMYGAGGADEFAASFGDDLIDGGAGNDYLGTGWKGDDVILGGDGDDMMFLLPFDPRMWPSDPGRDRVDGGAGNDNLTGLDLVGRPEPDNITCGSGDDLVVADRLDVVAADCERVEFPPTPAR